LHVRIHSNAKEVKKIISSLISSNFLIFNRTSGFSVGLANQIHSLYGDGQTLDIAWKDPDSVPMQGNPSVMVEYHYADNDLLISPRHGPLLDCANGCDKGL
jgi:hypothetical protein